MSSVFFHSFLMLFNILIFLEMFFQKSRINADTFLIVIQLSVSDYYQKKQ